MQKALYITAAAAALIGATQASAQTTTLTFGDLQRQYGDGQPILSNMTNDGTNLSYTSDGYVLTLTAGDPFFGGVHIGDAGNAGTYNWHDGGDNGLGSFVTLTKVGGGLFSLTSFDYSSNVGFVITAGASPALELAFGSGTSNGFSNVSSIRFNGLSQGQNSLDNLVLTAGVVSGAVPEPATWGMMLLGFGAAGYAMRRRAKVRTNVSFA